MRIKLFLLSLLVYFLPIQSSWNNIEDVICNSVVKIFAAEKVVNWFYPYNIASTHSSGTGFFIDNKGYIITCAHVVRNANMVSVGLPALGKKRFKAHVIGLCVEYDTALLCLDEDSLIELQSLGIAINPLALGNSDLLKRGEEIVVLGYPGTEQSDLLKSSAGVISFNNGSFLQYDAASNPGNSGGPLLNENYEVIGFCKSGDRANGNQGINFAVPINIAKLLLPHLAEHKLLVIDHFGIVVSYANAAMKQYLNCPEKGGCYICSAEPTKQAYEAGLRADDIFYAIDGFAIDNFGELISPFNGERIHFVDYIAQMPIGVEIKLSVYRNGNPLEFTLTRTLKDETCHAISYKYPAYEDIDFEIFGGLIVMPLTINYIDACTQARRGLKRYLTCLYNEGPRLVVANIIAGSQISQCNISYADTINEVNGETVKTIDDFRKALLKSLETGFFILKTTDEQSLNTDNVTTVLHLNDSCRETIELSHVHNYALSAFMKQFVEQAGVVVG